MIIDAYIICWNEIQTIHLTVNHYKKFCRNIFIFDNFSDDGTAEKCQEMGCIVEYFGIAGQLNDQEYLKIKNHKWKGSDADWVIVCDADEILYDEHKDIISLLDHAQLLGCTIIKPQGFNIFSESLPVKSWDEIKTGVLDNNYSKLICFNPKAFLEIGYVYGCHEAKPLGEVRSYDGGMLLHYKHVGGAKRLADRHALYAERLSDVNKRWKMGFQYTEPRSQTIKYFNENLAKAKALW